MTLSNCANINYIQPIAFTPTFLGGTVAGTTTYTIQTGKYIKVGNLVLVNINVSGSNTGSGNIVFGSLPFTIKNQANYNPSGCAVSNNVVWPNAGCIYVVGIPNTTTCQLGSNVNANATGNSYVQVPATTKRFQFNLLYQV